MEAGGRLVHDVDVTGPGPLGGEPEALRFAAGEGGQRLTQAQVADAHVDQEPQAAPDARSSVAEPLQPASGARCVVGRPHPENAGGNESQFALPTQEAEPRLTQPVGEDEYRASSVIGDPVDMVVSAIYGRDARQGISR